MKTTDKKSSAMAETVKTLLLVLLTLSMLALIVVYIGGTHIYQSMTDTGEKRVFDKLWSVQGGQRSEGLDQSRLLPRRSPSGGAEGGSGRPISNRQRHSMNRSRPAYSNSSVRVRTSSSSPRERESSAIPRLFRAVSSFTLNITSRPYISSSTPTRRES